MLNSPIFAFFIQGIPESIVLAVAGLTICNAAFRSSDVAKIAVCQTIAAFFVKRMPLTSSVHSIILIFSLALFVSLFNKMKVLRCIIVSLTGFLLMSLVENGLYRYWTNVLHVDFASVVAMPLLRIRFGLQVPLVAAVIVFLYSLAKKKYLSPAAHKTV
jgi:hypothetical protein